MRANGSTSISDGGAIDRSQVVSSLVALGVQPDVLQSFPEIPADVSAIMVYGSQARGDAIPGSDLDILALASSGRPSTYSGDTNISYYTAAQLQCGIGTLFGAHLKRDGKILADPKGELATVLDSIGDVDTPRLLERSLNLSQLFTCPERDLPKYLPGLVRQARYLLRSCLYAQAIADGEPCFSVRELSIRHRDPELVHLLSSRHSREPTLEDYRQSTSRLKEIVGPFPPNPHRSLEATIVNEWETNGDLLSMAFLALGITGQETDYAEVEKILL